MRNHKKMKKNSKRSENHPPHYLALALIALLLIEGVIGTATSAADWQNGLSMLDVTSAVSEVSSDVAKTFEPMVETVLNINLFYGMSTNHMTELLDLSDYDLFEEVNNVVSGVNDFYDQASTQMIAILDFSSTSTWPARVAGVSIEK